MTDKHDKLVEMALKSGAVNHFVQGLPDRYAFSLGELAALRSAILADAAKDVQAVAWSVTCDGEHVNNIHTSEIEANRGKRNLDRDFPDHTREVVPLVPASTLAAAQARIAELVARLEGLEKDAARYRWLRDCNSGSLVVVQITGTGEDDWYVLTEDDADAAIDAAITARGKT